MGILTQFPKSRHLRRPGNPTGNPFNCCYASQLCSSTDCNSLNVARPLARGLPYVSTSSLPAVACKGGTRGPRRGTGGGLIHRRAGSTKNNPGGDSADVKPPSGSNVPGPEMGRLCGRVRVRGGPALFFTFVDMRPFRPPGQFSIQKSQAPIISPRSPQGSPSAPAIRQRSSVLVGPSRIDTAHRNLRYWGPRCISVLDISSFLQRWHIRPVGRRVCGGDQGS